MNELVSIITPSYNTEKFIAETIESVVSQSYQNWEMIIVDDVSTDRSVKIIENYIKQDSRIKLIKLKSNSGAAVARNKAIAKANGRFIAFIDSDDLWKPTKLEEQISFMLEKAIVFTYSAYNLIDEEGKSLNIIKNPLEKVDYVELLKENQIGCLTVVYDKEKLDKCYMPLIRKRQDYGLWLSILKKTPYAYKVPNVLASYRVRQDSISRNKINLLKYNYKLFYIHEEFSILKSSYYVAWNIYKKLKIGK